MFRPFTRQLCWSPLHRFKSTILVLLKMLSLSKRKHVSVFFLTWTCSLDTDVTAICSTLEITLKKFFMFSFTAHHGQSHHSEFSEYSFSRVKKVIASFLSYWDFRPSETTWQQMMCIPHSFVLTLNGCHLVVSMKSASLLTYISELCRILHRNCIGTLNLNYICNASFLHPHALAWGCRLLKCNQDLVVV
jgi:hypothetical protein